MTRGTGRGIGRGIGLYLGALAMFAGMDACTKALVVGLPVAQVTWARFAFQLLLVALVIRGRALARRGTTEWAAGLPWRSRAPGLQGVRSLALAACNLFFALALVHVPLARATAINFAAPVLTVILAGLWLKERVGWSRACGAVVGLAGVLVVLRPFGGAATHPAALWALASALSFAIYHVLTRRLVGTDTPRTTIFHTGLWPTVLLSCVAPFVWVWPDGRGWAALVAVGLLGGASHFMLVLAYERAPASLLAPMAYMQMIWATGLGLVLFGEVPDAATMVGGLIIVGGGLLALWGGPGGPGRVASRTAALPAGSAPEAGRI